MRFARYVIPIAVALFLTLFLVLPLTSLVWVSFSGEPSNIFADLARGDLGAFWRSITTQATLDYYAEFFRTPRYRIGLVNGVLFSSAVTVACCVLGASLAFAFDRFDLPFSGALRVLAILPLAIPSFLMALSVQFLFGRSGIVTTTIGPVLNPFSPLGCGVVQAFTFFPLVYLTATATLERMDPALDEASAVLGAPRVLTFCRVSLPMLAPGMAAGAFLAFIRSFGDFASLQLLMPSKIRMIVVEAYRDMSGNAYWGGAATLSTVMIVVILCILAIQKLVVERNRFETMTGRAVGARRKIGGPALRGAVFTATAAVLAFPVMNLVVIALLSVSGSWGNTLLPDTYSLSHFEKALVTSPTSLVNSLALTAMALAGSLLLAGCVAYTVHRGRSSVRHGLDFIVQLPFVLPGTAFAIALVTVFNNPPLALHLTVYIVVLAYIVTRTPYGVRTILASLQQIGPAMEESSRTLGANDVMTLAKVLVPLIRPGIVAGGVMIFISCMTDVAITLMVCPPSWYPASLSIFVQIADARYFDASAYGLILMGMIFAPYAFLLRRAGAKQMSI